MSSCVSKRILLLFLLQSSTHGPPPTTTTPPLYYGSNGTGGGGGVVYGGPPNLINHGATRPPHSQHHHHHHHPAAAAAHGYNMSSSAAANTTKGINLHTTLFWALTPPWWLRILPRNVATLLNEHYARNPLGISFLFPSLLPLLFFLSHLIQADNNNKKRKEGGVSFSLSLFYLPFFWTLLRCQIDIVTLLFIETS